MRTWEEATAVASNWAKWGGITPPIAIKFEPKYELRTIAEAIEQFNSTQKSNGCDSDRLVQYGHLLDLRLIPFAASKRIEFIQQMDNAEIWGQFRQTWKNENPHKNRTPKPEEANKVVLLGKRTEGRLISDLRVFHTFCVSREWLSDNWASKKHKMFVSVGVDPKEPFSDEELEYIYKASGQITDGRGFSTKRTGTKNGRETLIFAWVLRYTGLRISDVTMMESSQLVPFKSGRYTHALYCNPKKTRGKKNNFVHIPIPNGAFPHDPNLVAALESLPLKNGRFFFLGGAPLPPTGSEEWKERLHQATTNWRARIDRLFVHASNLMAEAQPPTAFGDRPHPHRFRHTFAATLLRAGVSLRIVAQYLGDTEEVVRDHYAKFCIAEQEEAASVLEKAMLKAAEQRKARLLPKN